MGWFNPCQAEGLGGSGSDPSESLSIRRQMVQPGGAAARISLCCCAKCGRAMEAPSNPLGGFLERFRLDQVRLGERSQLVVRERAGCSNISAVDWQDLGCRIVDGRLHCLSVRWVDDLAAAGRCSREVRALHERTAPLRSLQCCGLHNHARVRIGLGRWRVGTTSKGKSPPERSYGGRLSGSCTERKEQVVF